MTYATEKLVRKYGPRNQCAYLVLLSLAAHANDAGCDCFPAVETICEEKRMSKRSVIRGLKRLAIDGWIEVTKESRDRRANSYQIIMAKLADLAPNSPKSVDGDRCQKRHKKVPKLSKIGAKTVKPPHPLKGVKILKDQERSFKNISPSQAHSTRVENTPLFPSEETKEPQPVKRPPQAYVDYWNANRGPLPGVRKLTPKRRKHLDARIAEGLTPDEFKKVIAKIHASPFLLGDKDWFVTFDFVICNEDNLNKILEGSYDRAAKPKPVRIEMPNQIEPRRDR